MDPQSPAHPHRIPRDRLRAPWLRQGTKLGGQVARGGGGGGEADTLPTRCRGAWETGCADVGLGPLLDENLFSGPVVPRPFSCPVKN